MSKPNTEPGLTHTTRELQSSWGTWLISDRTGKVLLSLFPYLHLNIKRERMTKSLFKTGPSNSAEIIIWARTETYRDLQKLFAIFTAAMKHNSSLPKPLLKFLSLQYSQNISIFILILSKHRNPIPAVNVQSLWVWVRVKFVLTQKQILTWIYGAQMWTKKAENTEQLKSFRRVKSVLWTLGGLLIGDGYTAWTKPWMIL